MEKRKGNFLKSGKLIIFIALVLIIMNIIIYLDIKKTKANIFKIANKDNTSQIDTKIQPEFFDSFCPDIEAFTIQQKKIILSDLVGDVIILRFTRFHPQDIPYLIYLEHLFKSFQNEGIHLFFIYSLIRKQSKRPNHPNTFSEYIIEDDGYISALFQARMNDTIIVGRDFRIKFKHNQFENRIIYNQVIKYLFDDKYIPRALPDKEISSLLKKISFKNLENKKIEKLSVLIRNKPVFITLLVSTCLGCPEHQRISLMKEITSEMKASKKQIILLFSKGNDFDSIKKFSEKYALLDDITIGIINDSKDLIEEDYYRIFKLDIDPRTFIFNKEGELIFLEKLNNGRKINTDFIREKFIE